MSIDITFSEEIARMEDALERAQDELEELQSRRMAHDVQTRELRQSLQDLRATLRGELPRPARVATTEIEAVEVDPETGRPSRGARREQVEEICKKLGAGGQEFRTVDVLNEIRRVEGEVGDGMRSYIYAVMKTLEEDDFLEKVGRGTWKLKRRR